MKKRSIRNGTTREAIDRIHAITGWSLEQIAVETGISRSTIYAHYKESRSADCQIGRQLHNFIALKVALASPFTRKYAMALHAIDSFKAPMGKNESKWEEFVNLMMAVACDDIDDSKNSHLLAGAYTLRANLLFECIFVKDAVLEDIPLSEINALADDYEKSAKFSILAIESKLETAKGKHKALETQALRSRHNIFAVYFNVLSGVSNPDFDFLKSTIEDSDSVQNCKDILDAHPNDEWIAHNLFVMGSVIEDDMILEYAARCLIFAQPKYQNNAYFHSRVDIPPLTEDPLCVYAQDIGIEKFFNLH